MTRPTALILGAAVWQGGVPSPTLKLRSLHGAQLFLTGTVDHIIACGGLGMHAPSEAEVIRDICVAAGVPETAITLEDRSATTQENIAFACKILGAQRDNVIIVTNTYHAPRAQMIAKRSGLEATSSCPSSKGMKWSARIKAILREGAAITLHLLRIQRPKR